MQNLKIFIKLIILIALIIYIKSIYFGISTGYFESDIEFFQTNIDVYSKYTAGIFILISFLFLIFKNRNEIKPKDPNIISPEFLKHTPLIIFIAIIIYTGFEKTVTSCSLIINKQKEISSVKREFKIDSYNEKEENLRLSVEKEVELGVITEVSEFYKMKKDIYKSLEDKKNIKLKFKIGLLGIPFDPEYKK